MSVVAPASAEYLQRQQVSDQSRQSMVAITAVMVVAHQPVKVVTHHPVKATLIKRLIRKRRGFMGTGTIYTRVTIEGVRILGVPR